MYVCACVCVCVNRMYIVGCHAAHLRGCYIN